MAYPDPDTDWAALARDGFVRVVRLHPGDYDPSPLAVDEVPLEDLWAGGLPADPAAERDRVLDASRLAAQSIERGEGVVVHCVGGTGRTGTVLACTLRLLGHSADDAFATVQAHRPHWPESPWQEEIARGPL